MRRKKNAVYYVKKFCFFWRAHSSGFCLRNSALLDGTFFLYEKYRHLRVCGLLFSGRRKCYGAIIQMQ